MVSFVSVYLPLIPFPPSAVYSDTESVTTSRRSISRESSVVDLWEGIPPVFAQTLDSIEITREHKFEIEVCVSTQTKPIVRWMKNGKEIKESKRIKMSCSEEMYQFKIQT